MELRKGIEYNIKPAVHREITDPVFRGIILRFYPYRKEEGIVDMTEIQVTEYNLTKRYSRGDIIKGIPRHRFISVVEKSNKEIAKNVLTLFHEED